MHVFTLSQGIVSFSGGEALANTVLGTALWHLPCSMSFSRTEMGNQPKGNFCFYTIQLPIFLWLPSPLWRSAGVTACCFSPHSLPQQKLEERGERDLETEKHHPHVTVGKVPPSLPAWVSSLPPSLGFLPVHYVGFHFFHQSYEEDLVISEILIFTCHSSCCCKVREVSRDSRASMREER